MKRLAPLLLVALAACANWRTRSVLSPVDQADLELLAIFCGFDAARTDPEAQVTVETCRRVTRSVMAHGRGEP